MGQKIKPTILRLGITTEWDSRWFPKKFKFGAMLEEDQTIRNLIKEKIGHAGIASVTVEKTAAAVRVTIRTARPGLIIGRGGKGIEELTQQIEAAINAFRSKKNIKEKVSLSLNIEEIKRYEASAPITAQNIAADLEKRMPYRRTIKKHLERTMQSRDVKGAKIRVSGRLDGNEIARTEWLTQGSLPLQTIRANVDYGEATAYTTYGTIGVKVWIYKGEIFRRDTNSSIRPRQTDKKINQ